MSTPSKYINELRLSYAANLLASSNLNATDVCYECGFQNVSWFYNEFAERFGYSSTAAVIRETLQGHRGGNSEAGTPTGCLVPLLIGLSGIMFSIVLIVVV